MPTLTTEVGIALNAHKTHPREEEKRLGSLLCFNFSFFFFFFSISVGIKKCKKGKEKLYTKEVG